MPVYEVCEGIRYYLDERVAKVLDKKRQLVHQKDRDFFIIVDGEEGSGKSYLAFQLAKYVDPTFNLSRVAFTGLDFLKVIQRAKKGNSVVFDEAFTGLSARASMSEINKLLVETIMEVRKKNLFVFIVLPSVFYLDRYVVLSRGRVLFHTYLKKERRGNYSVYDKAGLKNLALNGRKTMSYHRSISRPKIYAKFTGKFALDVEGSNEKAKKYDDMKVEAIQTKGKNKLKEKQTAQRDILLARLVYSGFPQSQIISDFEQLGYPIAHSTVVDIVNRIEPKLMALGLERLPRPKRNNHKF